MTDERRPSLRAWRCNPARLDRRVAALLAMTEKLGSSRREHSVCGAVDPGDPTSCYGKTSSGRTERLALRLFQRALERMLILSGEIDHLADLGLGHLVGEDAAHADALLVDRQHHARRILQPHAKETLQAQ